jgi:hypothetical protein
MAALGKLTGAAKLESHFCMSIPNVPRSMSPAPHNFRHETRGLRITVNSIAR